MEKSAQILFVYGSLKRNGSAHHLLKNASRFLGEAKVRGRIVQHNGFPAIIADEAGWVEGEIFLILKNESWPLLDEYEGSDYVRQIVHALCNGKKLQAQAYFFKKISNTTSIKF